MFTVFSFLKRCNATYR